MGSVWVLCGNLHVVLVSDNVVESWALQGIKNSQKYSWELERISKGIELTHSGLHEWTWVGWRWGSVGFHIAGKAYEGPNSTLNLRPLGQAIKAVLPMGIPPHPPWTPWVNSSSFFFAVWPTVLKAATEVTWKGKCSEHDLGKNQSGCFKLGFPSWPRQLL